jgi:hypothetical protein
MAQQHLPDFLAPPVAMEVRSFSWVPRARLCQVRFACVILRVATDLVASFGGLAGDGAFGVGLAQRPTNFRNGMMRFAWG